MAAAKVVPLWCQEISDGKRTRSSRPTTSLSLSMRGPTPLFGSCAAPAGQQAGREGAAVAAAPVRRLFQTEAAYGPRNVVPECAVPGQLVFVADGHGGGRPE